jgi:hypothetical protein
MNENFFLARLAQGFLSISIVLALGAVFQFGH